MFSIIMPTYNCERYVEEAINSVLSQTYSDYELIIVDDGSSDNTFDIIKSIADKNEKISVYRNEHMGVSAARNTGIKNAKHKYVLFIDGDDTWDSDLLKNCNDAMKENCDLAVFGIRSTFYTSDDEFVRSTEKDYSVDGVREYSLKIGKNQLAENINYLFKSNNMSSPCNKIYLRSILFENGLEFSTDCVYLEDLKFNLDYLNYAENVEIIPQSYYNYRLFVDKKQMLKRKFKAPFLNADAIFASTSRFLERWHIKAKDVPTIAGVALNAYYQELMAHSYEQDLKTKIILMRQLNKNRSYGCLLKCNKGKFFAVIRLLKVFGLEKKQLSMINKRVW